jgi:O-antigen/teichoic acid export membrane protein
MMPAPAFAPDLQSQAPATRHKKRLNEVLWVAAGYGLAALGSVASVRLLTNMLEPRIYGQVALVLSLAALAQQIGFAPVAQAATRFFAPSAATGELQAYLAGCRRITLITAVFCGVAGAFLAVLGRRSLSGTAIATGVYVCAFGATSILAAIQTAARQRRIVALHGAAGAWLRAGLAALFVLIFGPASAAVLAGFAATYLLILGSQWRAFTRAFGRNLSPRPWPSARTPAPMLRYAWPFAAWGALAWVQTNIDRWAIAGSRSVEEVGLYQVVYQIGYQPITLGFGFLAQLVTPVIFARAGDGTDQDGVGRARSLNRQALLGTLAVTACAVAISALLHREILRIFAAPQYRAASYLLPILVAASGLTAAAQVAGIGKMMEFKTRELLLAQAVPTVLGTAALPFACRAYGLLGVGVTDVAAAALALAAVLWMGGRSPQAGIAK